MLSSKAKYALRAALVLADSNDNEAWIGAAQISADAVVPQKYLEAILVQLRDQGLIESRRGPRGGHRLAMPAEDINIAELIRIIDGPIALTPCASRTQFAACDDCVDIKSCRLRGLMSQVRDAAAAVLEGCSLLELSQQPDLVLASASRVSRRRSIG